jgi:hypothetical protein
LYLSRAGPERSDGPAGRKTQLAQGAIDYFQEPRRYEIEKAEPSFLLGFAYKVGFVVVYGQVDHKR